jgi:hypothetical protein
MGDERWESLVGWALPTAEFEVILITQLFMHCYLISKLLVKHDASD